MTHFTFRFLAVLAIIASIITVINSDNKTAIFLSGMNVIVWSKVFKDFS